jgi:hypothetical protein
MHSRPDASRMSRRAWTALVGAAPLLGQVTQKTAPQGSPKPAPPAATPEQKIQKAMADVKQVSDRLAQLEVPMNLEPAFAFRP